MLIEVAISTKSQSDKVKALEAFAELAPLGQKFSVKMLEESINGFLLIGETEAELQSLVDRARREFDFPIEAGSPQAAFRETITRAVTVRHTHKRQTGGTGEFAEVTILFEPLTRGTGFVFASEAEMLSIEFAQSVAEAISLQKEKGLIAGFPVTDFKATLVEGKYHEVDSSLRTFDIAARLAFAELRNRGGVKILEPIMKVETAAPDEFLGGVIGDFNARRGTVEATESSDNAEIVVAMVPLANLFGYGKTLEALSQGRASFSMIFSHYEFANNPRGDDDDPRFPPAIGMRA
ncbi:MAG TPA: hypothetical protein VIM56_15930 [Rhizomicrobium sp.]